MNKNSSHGDVKEKLPTSDQMPSDVPPAEEELGGGDICSLEERPSTDDDKPLE